MIKVWTGNKLNCSHIPLLYPNWGIQEKSSNIFFPKKIFANFKRPFIETVSDPSLADFLLIPHNFPFVRDKKEYLGEFARFSEKHNKKIIIFMYGDSDEKVKLPNTIVFRTSCYKSKKEKNEIIMPAFVEDMAEEFIFKPREKANGKPVVGFCGWASVGGLKNRIKLFIKSGDAKKNGILLRKKAIKTLKNSKLVETNFIERQTYSGHSSTISLPPEMARKEFVENMNNSDFALTARGNGNFSFRFYEALSAGRVPVFINTDCALPFEDRIKYDDFVLMVDFEEINKIDVIISQFYKNIDKEIFILMQKKAKEVFKTYLKADKFFEIMFSDHEIKKFL